MPSRTTSRQSGITERTTRRRDGLNGNTRMVQSEYLSLVEIVRTGVDTARRARAESVRARLEDLIAHGHETDDGSVRVLRAALKKADQQRAAMLAEERRVSRARHRMRRIEDKTLLLHASARTRSVHRERLSISQQRVQSYCALRSQLRVKSSLTTLRKLVQNLNALLQALTRDKHQTQRRSETIPPLEENDADAVRRMDYDADSDSSEDLDIRDGIMSLDGAPSSTGTAATTATDSTQLSIGSMVRKILSRRVRSHDAQISTDDTNELGQRGSSEYGGTEQSYSRLLRVMFARKRFGSGGGGDGTETQGTGEYNGEMEDSRIFDGFKSTVKASKGLARYTVTRIRNPGKVRKLWIEADERYSLVLTLAPHFIEESMVPLGTIEGGLLGEWPGGSGGRRRNSERTAYMRNKVGEAITLVAQMEDWQTQLVERIRVDYRAQRDRLREVEATLSRLYVEQITGSTTGTSSRASRSSRSSSRVRMRSPVRTKTQPVATVNGEQR